MKIIAFVGSLRKESYNAKLATALPALVPAGMEIERVGVGELPLYNSDLEASYPSAAAALKEKVKAAEGVIFVTPEYNRSLPGSLKNAIDWLSRPYGTNAFKDKPALIMGVSSGKIGTALAQSHLRMICEYLEMDAVTQPELYLGPAAELFDSAGALSQDSTKALLTTALAALAHKVDQNQNR